MWVTLKWSHRGRTAQTHLQLQHSTVFSCSVISQLFVTFLHYSPPSSSLSMDFSGRILEWVAISLSRGTSRTKDHTQVSLHYRQILTIQATREASQASVVERGSFFMEPKHSVEREYSNGAAIIFSAPLLQSPPRGHSLILPDRE